MPEYLSPGVYVEEVPSGPRPIQGVGTSTAGFVGQTARGTTQPRLVTSWGDFIRRPGNRHRVSTSNWYLVATAAWIRWARRRGMTPRVTDDMIKERRGATFVAEFLGGLHDLDERGV